MKPALVLGLALAANAMVADNELGITQQVLQLPVDHVAFDEVADDELRFVDKVNLPKEGTRRFIPPYFDKETGTWKTGAPQPAYFDDELAILVHPRDTFKSEEEYQRHLQRIIGDFNRPSRFPVMQLDEAADDELAVALPPRSAFKSDEEYKKMVASMRYSWDDAADDELAITGPGTNWKSDPRMYAEYFKYRTGVRSNYYDAADEELAVTGPPMKRRSDFKSDAEYKHYLQNTRLTWDDELAVKIVNLPGAENGNVAYDDEELYVTHKIKRPSQELEADDELAITGLPRSADPEVKFRHRVGEFFREVREIKQREKRTAANDDELAVKIVNLPAAENGNVAYDDELLLALRPRSDFKSDEAYLQYAARMRPTRDDAADDEFLVIPPAAPRSMLGVRVVHRPTASAKSAYAYDDDELAFISRVPRVYIDRNVTRPAKNHTKTHEAHKIFTRDERNHARLYSWNRTHPALDDEADNELPFISRAPRVFIDRNVTRPAKNHTKTHETHRMINKDDEADDENYSRTAHWNRSLLARDDEADNELPFISRVLRVYIDKNVTRPAKNHTKTHQTPKIFTGDDDENYPSWNRTFLHQDDEADDEFGLKIVNLQAAHVAFDDDELAFMPRAPKIWFDRNVTRPAKNRTKTGHSDYRVLARDDEADDELAFFSKIPRVWFPRNATKSGKNRTITARPDERILAKDDEGDDELLYLGQLLQAHTLDDDDDEFRVKGEIPRPLEMGVDGFTIKKNLRPAF